MKKNARFIKTLPFEKWTRYFHTIWDLTARDLIKAGVSVNKLELIKILK
ncbi:MAG: hypothetical protein RMJ67_09115 [Elusimicrobiota bacterium]|nr:hypothetical protein [Endomicrobiia bacterium]MDW8166655.1 hypothetical protein [Elusimicrobiota bacterium]